MRALWPTCRSGRGAAPRVGRHPWAHPTRRAESKVRKAFICHANPVGAQGGRCPGRSVPREWRKGEQLEE
eukprot:6886167-Prymnesium_polylepis.1